MKIRSNWSVKFAVAAFGLMVGLCKPGLFAGGVGFVPTMNELRSQAGTPDQVVRLGGYHRVGDLGGGEFVWRVDSVKADNGGTVIAAGAGQGRWERVFDGTVQVTYFGATGDGVTDDTTAIQAAINSVSSTASPGVIFDEGRKVGGTVRFPSGRYRISDTLYVGPSTTLIGEGSTGGFQRRSLVEGDMGSVIVATFDDPMKWVISSAVYWRKGDQKGEAIGARQIFSGKRYDKAEMSRANAIRIKDLLLIGETNQQGEPPYGGIRLQACPGSVLEGVGVFGVDIAFLVNSGWGLTIRNCFSQSYLYGLLALYSVNGLHVDGCYFNNYGRSNRKITDENILTGGDPNLFGKRAVGVPNHYSHLKTGILTHYALNITLTNVITEHWDIARYHRHTNAQDTGSWLEANREMSYVLIESNLNLVAPVLHDANMMKAGRFMHLGMNSQVNVQQSRAFPISYGASPTRGPTSDVLISSANPDRDGWIYYPEVVRYVQTFPGVIQVGGDDDPKLAANALADNANFIDLQTALERIAGAQRRDWVVKIKAGAVCTLNKSVELRDKNVRLEILGQGQSPRIEFAATSNGSPASIAMTGGGALSLSNVDLHYVATAKDPALGGALITMDGGKYELLFENSRVDLSGQSKATPSPITLLEQKGASILLEVSLIDTVVQGGRALFVESGTPGSRINVTGLKAFLSPALFAQGVKGWGQPGNIQVTGIESL